MVPLEPSNLALIWSNIKKISERNRRVTVTHLAGLGLNFMSPLVGRSLQTNDPPDAHSD